MPTLREQGVEVDASAWFGMFGPAGMPTAVTDRLNLALQAALKSLDVMERLGKMGLTTAPGSSGEMAQRMAQDKATWAPAIKASAFKAD